MNATNEFQQFRKAAYEAACLAETLWDDELNRVYGTDRLSARYDSKRNAATPLLKALYALKNDTTNAWLTAGKINRNEIAA